MKLKLITFLLGITTLLLGVTAYTFYLISDRQTKIIADRELTITNYKKVINAFGKSGEISIEKLRTELKTDFDFNEKIGYNDFSKEYYYVLTPKNYDINNKEIWKFMGLELILDEQKIFKTVNMHKP